MQTFPKPLNKREEQEYLDAYKEGSIEAKNKLIEHNLRLVAHIVKKYQYSEEEIQDMISIGTIGLMKAVTSFDAEKGRLATYAARCIENELLMTLRSHKKLSREVSLYEPIGKDKEGNVIELIDVCQGTEDNIADQMEKKQLCKEVMHHLTTKLSEREREVVSMRYGIGDNDEMTQREIGKRLGISRSYVSRIEKKALSKLRLEMDEK